MSSKIQRKAMAIQSRKKRAKVKGKFKADGGKKKKYPQRCESTPTASQSEDTISSMYSDEEDNENEIVASSDEDEQESPEDYCKGGYHPVKIGDLFKDRYHVVRKLGWGHFSTVWLCWDLQGKRFTALKVVKSAQHYTETALDEIKLLRCVRESDPLDSYRDRSVSLLDDFKVTGIHGVHVCMVFEVLGCNLLKLITKSSYRGIPLLNVKNIVKQTLEGLAYLHTKCQIIHTDIKPENILLCVTDSHIKQLAAEAVEWQKTGLKLPQSAVSTAPKEPKADLSKLTKNQKKNQKKKLKKKQKRQQELLDLQKQQLNELGTGGAAALIPPSSVGFSSELSTEFTADLVDSSGTTMEENRLTSSEQNSETENTDDHEVNGGYGDQPCTTEQETDDKKSGEEGTSNGMAEPNEAITDKLLDRQSKSPEPDDCSSTTPTPSLLCNGNVTIESLSNGNNNADSADEQAQESITQATSDVTEENTDRYTSQEKLQQDTPVSHDTTDSTENNGHPFDLTSHSSSEESPAVDLSKEAGPINCKIADLGNACWTHKHFTEDIQTRQYRCLEVLVGAPYGTAADIWSTACMTFELATGDYLFEPHSGDGYSRDEDHLAHIIELLGPIPRHIALGGKYSREYFNRRGELRHINKLKPWPLVDVLMEKYEWPEEEAIAFANFLVPMLEYEPSNRATAEECLKHPWLEEAD
ncbi:SRSF protein kinase 3-like [Watersipora subatra]|uniref:SRSF protein kinase 3-like n=1 Tax=Watersipora subatra TaxID=2589382 RepID=UPI00355C0961